MARAGDRTSSRTVALMALFSRMSYGYVTFTATNQARNDMARRDWPPPAASAPGTRFRRIYFLLCAHLPPPLQTISEGVKIRVRVFLEVVRTAALILKGTTDS